MILCHFCRTSFCMSLYQVFCIASVHLIIAFLPNSLYGWYSTFTNVSLPCFLHRYCTFNYRFSATFFIWLIFYIYHCISMNTIHLLFMSILLLCLLYDPLMMSHKFIFSHVCIFLLKCNTFKFNLSIWKNLN